MVQDYYLNFEDVAKKRAEARLQIKEVMLSLNNTYSIHACSTDSTEDVTVAVSILYVFLTSFHILCILFSCQGHCIKDSR